MHISSVLILYFMSIVNILWCENIIFISIIVFGIKNINFLFTLYIQTSFMTNVRCPIRHAICLPPNKPFPNNIASPSQVPLQPVLICLICIMPIELGTHTHIWSRTPFGFNFPHPTVERVDGPFERIIFPSISAYLLWHTQSVYPYGILRMFTVHACNFQSFRYAATSDGHTHNC